MDINTLKQDIETKCLRKDLLPELTDQQYESLTMMALRAGFHDTSELIASFVSDLTGWQENGSDEHQFATLWYERAFGSITDFYLPWRYHVFNYDYDICTLMEEPEAFKEAYQVYMNEGISQHLTIDSWDDVQKINLYCMQNGRSKKIE